MPNRAELKAPRQPDRGALFKAFFCLFAFVVVFFWIVGLVAFFKFIGATLAFFGILASIGHINHLLLGRK